jgi:hypothetical protein
LSTAITFLPGLPEFYPKFREKTVLNAQKTRSFPSVRIYAVQDLLLRVAIPSLLFSYRVYLLINPP